MVYGVCMPSAGVVGSLCVCWVVCGVCVLGGVCGMWWAVCLGVWVRVVRGVCGGRCVWVCGCWVLGGVCGVWWAVCVWVCVLGGVWWAV